MNTAKTVKQRVRTAVDKIKGNYSTTGIYGRRTPEVKKVI